jgi:hypothetical protein
MRRGFEDAEIHSPLTCRRKGLGFPSEEVVSLILYDYSVILYHQLLISSMVSLP